MARRKITSGRKRKSVGAKKHHRSRRRVGASGKLEPIVMDALAVGAGIVAAREVSILAGSIMPSLMASPVETGIGETLLGTVLAWKSKNGFLRLVGLGAAGNGLMTILNGAGIIGGPKQMTYAFRKVGASGTAPRLQFVAGPQTRIGDYPNNFSLVAGRRGSKKRYTS